MFNGYTVKHSVDVIDEICNDPNLILDIRIVVDSKDMQ